MAHKIGQTFESNSGTYRYIGGDEKSKNSYEKVRKIGDIETSPTGTYRFMGGNAKDKNNWEKIDAPNTPIDATSTYQGEPEISADGQSIVPKKPYVDPAFPRASAVMADKSDKTGNLDVLNAYKSDALSLPGRILASTPEMWSGKKGRTFAESMRDIEGTHPVGKVFRNPATGAAVLASIPTFGTSIPALAGSIGVSSLAGATEQQLENINQGKDVSGKQFATETSFGILGGGLGVGGGKLLGAGLRAGGNKVGKFFSNRAVDKIWNEIKPTGKSVASGFKRDVLAENKIIGTPSEALKKTQAIIDENSKNIKQILNPPGVEGRTPSTIFKPKTEPTVDITDIVSKLSISNKITKGFSKEQKSALDDVIQRVSEIDPSGNVKLTDISEVKKIISELRNDFVNPPASQADKILGILYKEVDDAFIKAANKSGIDGAAIKASNKKISELIPIESTIRNKINQGIEEKIPGLFGKIAGGAVSGKNLAREFVANTLFPATTGVSTTMNVIGTIADYVSPSLASKLSKIKNVNITKTTPSKREINNIISKYRNQLSDADIKELQGIMKGYKAQELSVKANQRWGTFGTIGGQNTGGASRDY